MPAETNPDGALAAALAKAQGSFPAIPRDKEVTVQTKTGGSYKFKYAPLDSILGAVRKPLAENGLAITQLLDSGDLVTMLLHKDGGIVSGRAPLPSIDGIQAYGSAITYLRRYSIQAILGIAAEEDDDGNQAAGNRASFGGDRPAPKRLPPREDPATREPEPTAEPYSEQEELTGRASRRGMIRAGTSDQYKMDIRQGPDGPVLGFKLEVGPEKNIPQCVLSGALAASLIAAYPDPKKLIGTSAKVAGILYHVRGPQSSWYRLQVDRFENDEYIFPPDPADGPVPEPVEAPSVPLFDEDEQAKIDAALAKVPA